MQLNLTHKTHPTTFELIAYATRFSINTNHPYATAQNLIDQAPAKKKAIMRKYL